MNLLKNVVDTAVESVIVPPVARRNAPTKPNTTMTQTELQQILDAHAKWLRGDGGSRAVIVGRDLTGCNITDSNLTGCNITDSNLTGADLRDSNLTRADLRDSIFSGCNLTGADLRDSNLSGANLSESIGLIYAQAAFSGHGECGRMLTAAVIGTETVYYCGCFRGSELDLRDYIANGKPELAESRLKALEFVKSCLP